MEFWQRSVQIKNIAVKRLPTPPTPRQRYVGIPQADPQDPLALKGNNVIRLIASALVARRRSGAFLFVLLVLGALGAAGVSFVPASMKVAGGALVLLAIPTGIMAARFPDRKGWEFATFVIAIYGAAAFAIAELQGLIAADGDSTEAVASVLVLAIWGLLTVIAFVAGRPVAPEELTPAQLTAINKTVEDELQKFRAELEGRNESAKSRLPL